MVLLISSIIKYLHYILFTFIVYLFTMIVWSESQLILACIGMLGVMSVVPVYMYAGSKRNLSIGGLNELQVRSYCIIHACTCSSTCVTNGVDNDS